MLESLDLVLKKFKPSQNKFAQNIERYFGHLGLVHMPKLGMSFEMFLAWYIFGISCPEEIHSECPGLQSLNISASEKNAKIRIVLCSSLWAMELEKAISH